MLADQHQALVRSSIILSLRSDTMRNVDVRKSYRLERLEARDPPNRWTASKTMGPESALYLLGKRLRHQLEICDEHDAHYRLIETDTGCWWSVKHT